MHHVRFSLSGGNVQRSDAIRALGRHRSSILQQIIHDISMAAADGLMECIPNLCPCRDQIPSNDSITPLYGMLEWSLQQLSPLLRCQGLGGEV